MPDTRDHLTPERLRYLGRQPSIRDATEGRYWPWSAAEEREIEAALTAYADLLEGLAAEVVRYTLDGRPDVAARLKAVIEGSYLSTYVPEPPQEEGT